MKVLILTLSYFDDDIYTKFYNTQNETWNSLEVDGVETFFITGNDNSDEINGNLLKTNVEESLLNCGHKTLRSFDLIKNFDFDFIYRTNSSSYVDKKLLKKYLLDKPKENFYSGLVGNYHGILFASGSGFVISKDLVNLVLEKKDDWNHEYIDDVSLGFLLTNNNIEPTPSLRYDITSIDEKVPLDYYHYRIKNYDRNQDCEIMKNLHTMKLNMR